MINDAPSSTADDGLNAPPPPTSSTAEMLRSTFFLWEQLRLIYNLVLVVVVVTVTAWNDPSKFLLPHFWGLVIPGAVVANLCFFAGPVADSYLRWLGLRHESVTAGIFTLGTLLAIVLAIFSVTVLPLT